MIVKSRNLTIRKRRGVQSLEALLVIPVLVIALMAMMQFTAISSVLQAVEGAADEAAREVAKAEVRGGDFVLDAPAVAEDAVNRVLGVHGLNVLNSNGSGVRVFIEDADNDDGDADGNTSLSIGDSLLTRVAPAMGVAASEVRITILVSLDPAGGNNDPIPNLLNYFGLSFQGKRYAITATALKE
ncbi:TadE/TadG family type IV pilus assembly protein [Lignipirellula cremea]|uniref:TadE-like domain-containing protein n=1 Tax=Lignipirellula cremea TaxID=2528010 RepID=A0A518E542_9BACT|nr:TadE family protein [Lignipirellula cremea]QDU99215.1 hypothetical protein Pla8534_71280 [Lignipirellula cremea]